VVVREQYSLDQLENKRRVKVLELKTLSVIQQKEVLEDRKRIEVNGTEHLCRPARKSYGFKLIGEKHVTSSSTTVGVI
jgi:hypothetical protein